jgi:hypothetical protein
MIADTYSSDWWIEWTIDCLIFLWSSSSFIWKRVSNFCARHYPFILLLLQFRSIPASQKRGRYWLVDICYHAWLHGRPIPRHRLYQYFMEQATLERFEKWRQYQTMDASSDWFKSRSVFGAKDRILPSFVADRATWKVCTPQGKDLVFACGVHTVPDRSIRNE